MAKHRLQFILERETKGALRYRESPVFDHSATVEELERLGPDDFLVGTLYVRKAKMEGQPKVLNVTVEY